VETTDPSLQGLLPTLSTCAPVFVLTCTRPLSLPAPVLTCTRSSSLPYLHPSIPAPNLLPFLTRTILPCSAGQQIVLQPADELLTLGQLDVMSRHTSGSVLVAQDCHHVVVTVNTCQDQVVDVISQDTLTLWQLNVASTNTDVCAVQEYEYRTHIHSHTQTHTHTHTHRHIHTQTNSLTR
jgi:hypothetical protein